VFAAAGVAGELPAAPAGVAGELLAALAGAEVAEAAGVPLAATAEPSTTGGPPAASPDVVALAGPAAAGELQLPALLEAVSMVLICGTLMIAIPAASATASSAAIGAQPRLGFPAKLRA
jgi:hypothetical protein